MEHWRQDWMASKTAIANRLAAGEAGGSYGEAVIIVCAAISAVAADIWPGRARDKARFVELLKEAASPKHKTTEVSVPLLLDSLRRSSRISEARRLTDALLDHDDSRVVTGKDVDRSADELLTLCPALTRKDLHSHSYAALLYDEVRSSYAHQFAPGDRAGSWPMTSRDDEAVSYINVISEPKRRIHFHLGWLLTLANAVAAHADVASPSGAALPQPLSWWVNVE